jgi:uncharacterized damage-inducible protein DinB
MLGRYNTIANQRLYEACRKLNDSEYRLLRPGSFGSIHALLNHILLGDRIWLGRFEGGMGRTPALATILYDDFTSLRQAREAEDARIDTFLAALTGDFLDREIGYVNSAGIAFREPANLLLAHLFNHQTHHRGQVHVMLSQTSVAPPSLDMHRAIRPTPQQSAVSG